MRPVLLVAIGVSWLMWCVAFVASEVWLRRRGRSVEFGVASPGACAVALVPALPIGLALVTAPMLGRTRLPLARQEAGVAVALLVGEQRVRDFGRIARLTECEDFV